MLGLLDRYPIELRAGDVELPGQPNHLTGNGDVLVVLSEATILDATSAGRFEGSWAWADLCRQEIGPCATVDLDDLTAERLQQHRVAILTRSAASDPRIDAWVTDLEAFLSGGRLLAVELPTGALRTTFAADGNGGWRTPNQITAVEGVDDDVAATLMQSPLLTRFMGSTSPLENATTLMAMDGAPVIYARPQAGGHVVVFDFDVGAQIRALQQGVPSAGNRVRPRQAGEAPTTFDLVATSRLMNATVPYADLLERYVVHVALGDRIPLFSLWPYPEGRPAALITSHASHSLAGRPLWMSIHERALNARSSSFLLPPPGMGVPAAVAEDPDYIGHAALLWSLDPDQSGLFRGWGALGIEPVRRPLSLVGQLERLETALGDDASIRSVRTQHGRWTDEYTQAYRIMDAVEFRNSSTYGPQPGSAAGYLFGTCQPFTPLDDTGMPFRLQETPVCFLDPTTEEERALLTTSLANALAGSWAVHVLTSSDRFLASPDMDAFDAWRDALEYAQRHEMWIGGAGELSRFWRQRGAAELKVIGRDVERRDDLGRAQAVSYTVEAETSHRGLVMAVPERVGELRLDGVSRGSRHAQVTRTAQQVTTTTQVYLGRTFHLIPLNPGFTTVGVRYVRRGV